MVSRQKEEARWKARINNCEGSIGPRHHHYNYSIAAIMGGLRLLLLLAALALARSRAAHRVDIRVVPRPRAPVEAPAQGPFPIRGPVWVGAGPFWQGVSELACVSGVPVSFSDERWACSVSITD